MTDTQNHIAISDIKENIIVLKDGGGALILETNAVNFGLLSEREQIAIISSFAQMLNSLSFSIQIVIRSSLLDISSYIKLLDKAQENQTNQLLSTMISHYKNFVQSTIKDNEVLDKDFYLVLSAASIEIGIGVSKQDRVKKIKTILEPRRDQIVRQLSRVGLKSHQLTTQELSKLFFEIYNHGFTKQVNLASGGSTPLVQPVNLTSPQQATARAAAPQQQPQVATTTTNQAPQMQQSQPQRGTPFIVEELNENV